MGASKATCKKVFLVWLDQRKVDEKVNIFPTWQLCKTLMIFLLWRHLYSCAMEILHEYEEILNLKQ